MTITATVNVGLEFGTEGKMVTESKIFASVVDFEKFMSIQREFEAEDEVVSVKWEC